MYTYKDTTYCASPNCKNDCGRKLTPEIWEAAKKAEMMIAQSYFCGSPESEIPGFAVTPDKLKSLLRGEPLVNDKIEETKQWLQHRIDYWETEIEALDSESEDYDRGMLQAFYEVQEFLMGQRR